ncbi:MAG: winged helix-turn-helix transcriptional regulator [Rhodospirillales bacterium]|nr:winged helix-turn-helix transcriptional regulator [Rhodospirillales bacterium]
MRHSDRLSETFSALADPTRRAILARLAQGEASVGELAQPFRISAPSISRHLKALEHAKLIVRTKDAQWRRCRLRPQPLKEAADWITRYRRHWEDQLDRLAEYLDEMPKSFGAKRER